MEKRISKAMSLVNKAEGTKDRKAWRKASIACLAVVNNTTDHETSRRFNDLYTTCTIYARFYR